MRTIAVKKLFIAMAIILAFTSCNLRSIRQQVVVASDEMSTREIPLDEFTQLSMIGSHDLLYVEEKDGGQPRVVIEGPENVVELMEVKQDGSSVSISLEKGFNVRMNHKTLVIRAFSRKLNDFTLVGSGSAKLASGLDTDGLQLHLTGSGHINASSIHCNGEYTASVTGSGKIDVEGVDCEKCGFFVSGSGHIHTIGIGCRQVDASVTGSGNVMLEGEADEASLNVTGSGDIMASGLKSGKVNQSTTGSGKISL